MAKTESKIEWLRAVYESKETLFGAFSDKLTKQNKTDAWKQMHSKAQALALVPNNKEYTYTRDTFWQNLRKNAMKKRDNSRATGTGTTKFTKVDDMVYEIIGKESPTLVGLPVLESGDLQETTTYPPTLDTEHQGSAFGSKTNTKPATSIKSTRQNKTSFDGLDELKVKKIKLTISLLEKENYLKELKIKKLEKELNLPAKNFSQENAINTVTLEYEDDTFNDVDEHLDVEYLDSSD